MNRVRGFELVEQFLDNWKKEAYEWYMDQKKKYYEAYEERKANPSEAEKLYRYYGDDREEKIKAFLDTKYEREPDSKYWKVPRKYVYLGQDKYRLENSYNALVCVINKESEELKEQWSHVIKIYDHVGGKYSYESYVEAMLQKEYERKYEKLASDCYKITGAIQKADLRVNFASKNLEGFIYGEIGNAELWSTLSGGEVQCLHLRFYCHKRK